MNRGTLKLILRLIDLAALAVTALPELKREYDALRAQVEVFVDEDRDPTPEEWAALDARMADAHQRIQDA